MWISLRSTKEPTFCLIQCGLVLLKCIQFSSVTQLCPTLCDPMNCSTPGLPVHHQLPEFTEIHVHRVSGAIQPSHPLSSPSPPAPNPSQHQSLFHESTLRMRWPKYLTLVIAMFALTQGSGHVIITVIHVVFKYISSVFK